jgi:hypothetical protein
MKKRYKIPLVLISFLFLACLIFWIILTQTKFLENQVNRSLGVLVKTRYPMEVKVGNITGSFWDNVEIEGLTVDYTKEGQEYRMASIPYLKASYKLSNLWRKKWILDSLRISGPRFTIAKAKEGQLLIPLPEKRKGVISKTGLFDFRIGNLRIEDGSLEYLSDRSQTALDSLNLEAFFSKDDEGTKIQVLQCQFICPQKELLMKSLQGSFSIEDDTLFIKGLKLETGESRAEVSGDVHNLKDPQFSFSVKTDPINLEEIRKLSGVRLEGILDVEGSCTGNLKRFQGRAELDGKFFEREFDRVKLSYVYQNRRLSFPTVNGKIFDSPLNGNGELNFGKRPEEYRFEGEITHLDLNNVVFNSFHTDLTGGLLMEGRGFSERDLMMNMKVNLGSGGLDQFTLSAVTGSLTVTFSSVTFGSGFQMDYKNTQVVLNGELQYDGEVDINAKVNFDDLRDFENQIFIKQTAGRGKAELKISGKTSDFDIGGSFRSDSCYIYELYSSNVETEFGVANFLGKRKGSFDLSFLDGFAWGVPYDSLISRIHIDEDWVTIDSTSLENEYMNVALWGTLDISKVPQPLTLEKVVLNFRENHIESSSPAEASLDSLDVKINKAVFSCEEGEIEVSGTIDYEERMNLSFDLSEIDIASWMSLLTKSKIEGGLSLQGKVGGNFAEPQFDLVGTTADLKFEEMDLGRLETSLSYNDRRLEFKRFDITSPEGTHALSGFIPLDLSFSSVEKRFLEKPQSLSLKTKGKRLDLVRLFIPEIEYLKGPFEGDLEISGEFLHPQFDGKLNLENGTLKLVELSDPVSGLVVEMRMRNENLILDRVSGFMEHKEKDRDNLFKRFWGILSPQKKIRGEINGFGSISFEDINQPGFELYFVGEDVPVDYEYADLSAVADLTVEIVGKTPPLLSADVILSHLYYREPFASSATGTSFEPSSGAENLWDWNLDVSAVNNCWVINDDVNLEFKGDVLVVRERGELRILGNLETIRGRYFLYGTKFKIEEGSFVFDNIEKIDPKIDFLVSTDLRGATSKSSQGLDLFGTGSTNKIELAITGTISAPEVEPAPGSPYSKEDVIELLAFQRGFAPADTLETGAGATQFQERVIKSLGGAYGSRFLENIAGRSLGVETFEIVPAWGQSFSLRDLDAEITVGKYVSDKIYLRYTRRLSQSSGQEAGVEYRLNRHLLLEGRRDKIGLFHLGLSLNWEY